MDWLVPQNHGHHQVCSPVSRSACLHIHFIFFTCPSPASHEEESQSIWCPNSHQLPEHNWNLAPKVAKLVLVFVVIFVISFLPNHIFLLWFYYTYPKSMENYNSFWHYFKNCRLRAFLRQLLHQSNCALRLLGTIQNLLPTVPVLSSSPEAALHPPVQSRQQHWYGKRDPGPINLPWDVTTTPCQVQHELIYCLKIEL